MNIKAIRRKVLCDALHSWRAHLGSQLIKYKNNLQARQFVEEQVQQLDCMLEKYDNVSMDDGN